MEAGPGGGPAISVVTLVSFLFLLLLCVLISYCVSILAVAGYVKSFGVGCCLYVWSQFVVIFRQVYGMHDISILGKHSVRLRLSYCEWGLDHIDQGYLATHLGHKLAFLTMY